MEDRLENALNWALEKFKAEYIEIRYENVNKNTLELKDGTFTTFAGKGQMGVAIRVLADGAWGFASTNRLEQLENAIESAYKLARATAKAKKEKIQLAEVKHIKIL